MLEKLNRRGVDWRLGTEKRESFLRYFWVSRKWDQHTIIALLLGTLAVVIPLFVLYRGYFGNIDLRCERSLITSLLIAYVFLRYPLGRKKWNERINWFFPIDLILFLLMVATQIYTAWDAVVSQTDYLTLHAFSQVVRVDYVVGLVVLLLLCEAVRRSFGWIMVALPMLFIGYSLFASSFPGPLRGVSVSWTYLMEMLYVQNDGLYGLGAQVLLSMVFLFLLFGSLLLSTKAGAFFTAAASSIVGRYSGGPAKIAVIGSGLIGSISGSAISNVATTGAITIPMMKSSGYKSSFAGAVEACASAGGQLLPPVMGVAAFLMAIYTGIPYIKVCFHAVIPASLYFLAVFLQVHFRAKREALIGIPKGQLPSLRRVMAEGGHLIIPLLVIIISLVMGYSVTRVAVWGILAVILVSFVRKETRQNPRSFLVALERATDTMAPISVVILISGVVIGVVMVSGLGMHLSHLVESLAAGNMLIGLLLAAIIAIILGTGLNTFLIYLICLVFIIPAIIAIGLPVLVAHLFVFYFAVAAVITPPVCLASFTAAALADSPPMRTGLIAFRLGFAAYVVPFAFAYRPALLLLGSSLLESMLVIVMTIAAVLALAAGFEGWFLRRCSIFERILLIGAGGSLLFPSLIANGIGVGVMVLLALRQKVHFGYAK